MARLPDFNFRNLILTWGDLPFLALMDTGAFTVTPNGPITRSGVGSDSVVTRSMGTDTTAMVAVQLQALSPTNKNLADVVYDMRYGSGEIASANMTVSDPSGAIVGLLKGVVLDTAPEMGLQADMTTTGYTWTFHAEEFIFTSNLDGLSQETIDAYQEEATGYLTIFASFRVTI